MAKKKDPRGRKPGGVYDYVRRLIAVNPRASTPELREAARARFGYTPDIDRHFPQLVYTLRKEWERKIRRTGT